MLHGRIQKEMLNKIGNDVIEFHFKGREEKYKKKVLSKIVIGLIIFLQY